MPMWLDEPINLIVNHPDSIPTGINQVDITVTDSRAPVQNALVCLMSKLGEIYEYDYTDAAGLVSFNINPTMADTMWVTTTAMNHLPYEGFCRIYNAIAIEEKPKNANTFKFDLLVPRPNVFSQKTIISYTLDKDCRTSLIVYNALGQKLGYLVANTEQTKGKYSINWKGELNNKRLSAGIYFLKLANSTNEVMKKLVIVE
jgi:hypothetical protein